MHLLFDLDGTLTDPGEGIVKSINYALAKLDLPARDPAYLALFVGPSLRETFRVLLHTDDSETLNQSVAWYRERYFTQGWLENSVYSGIPDLLSACRSAGHGLYVATYKRQDIATWVLTHFRLAPYFTAVYGCDLDLSKGELLGTLLKEQGLTPENCIMIGDRKHDIEAGQANGMATIGTLWGYGTKEELTAARPDYLVDTPGALTELVRAWRSRSVRHADWLAEASSEHQCPESGLQNTE